VQSIIGIRREDKNEWERRVPLAPRHVKDLVGKGFDVHVQPSEIRIFKDSEYSEVGASVREDLSQANIVLGVKEFPIEFLTEAQANMFFAHVIKGQKYNMPMLRAIMDKGCTLIDYEKVTNDRNQRLIFFGNYAGLAGMLETLYTYGKRLEWEGHDTPFLGLTRPLEYGSLDEAKAALDVVGRWISIIGLPEGIGPMVVGFAGYGNVSKGAQSILDILPVEEIAPTELADFIEKGDYSPHIIYKVVFYEKDMVVPLNPAGKFELQNYYEYPEKYKGVFEQYLDKMSILMNCIYWDERCPRLVTKKWMKENW
jgi:saccharopine dehydrogenase (NAD+, L-lysine-forming)